MADQPAGGAATEATSTQRDDPRRDDPTQDDDTQDVTREDEDTPYRAMAVVYDRWMRQDQAPYEEWCSFIDHECRAQERPVTDILEIGCGTGNMSALLLDRGYRVTGVDASAGMLEVARRKLGDSVRLFHVPMPAAQPPDFGIHDAAICCFDTANYLVRDGELAETFRQIADALRPGGLFIVDTNTEYKFAQLMGNLRLGDDLDEFAYVWRSRYDAETHRCEFVLSFFLNEGGLYRRSVERHVQRYFSGQEVATALAATGFTILKTCHEYTDQPCTATTPRVTWVARLAPSGTGPVPHI